MRHQPEHVEMLRINPGDGMERAVAVGVRRHGPAGVAVAEGDAAVAFEAAQGFAVGEIIALAVRHAHLEGLARPIRPRKDRIGALTKLLLSSGVRNHFSHDDGFARRPALRPKRRRRGPSRPRSPLDYAAADASIR